MIKSMLLLAATLPLFAQNPCAHFTLSPTSVLAASAAVDPSNPLKFTVTTGTNCPFIAVTAADWIHLALPPNQVNFAGTSTVAFTVDLNAGTVFRKDQISIYAGTSINSGIPPVAVFAVGQLAAACTYSVSPPSANVPVSGGSGTLLVTAGCSWGASASTFVSLSAPYGTVGSAPLYFQVAANTCVGSRTGQINITYSGGGPLVFPVVQDGSISNLSISSSTNALTASAAPNQSVAVTTGPVCVWAAYTDSLNWLHAISGTSATGAGNYVYSVDANPGGPRTGHVYFESGVDSNGSPIIASTLTVTQQALQTPSPQITAILNGASFVIPPNSPGPVSPGEIVGIFGANMGPAAGVLNTQTFGTLLGGVQVMFGSTPAPLIYASAQQINAVVPYAVAGSSNMPVTVQYAGTSSPPFSVPVQPTTPGIFSLDHTGGGPGAILNQDNTVNEKARPAAVGSVVAIYCTGGGATVPAAQDGALTSLTPPFPSLAAQPVSVTIGGLDAKVAYAGPAPGAIAGLTQIDAYVPNGVASGSSVPVVVTIGGVASQSNLTMTVQ